MVRRSLRTAHGERDLNSALHYAFFAATPNIVDLGYATYQGVPISNTTNTQFLGIRFAASPTGSLRFRAPHPPASTPGVQVANQLSDQCFEAGQGIQPTSPFHTGKLQKRADVFSEDCLFLNVYVPGSIDPTKRLPVVFWIHGGGYQVGDGSDPGKDLFAFSNNGVVVVTVQYRLGAFGFLPGQKVKDSGALNAGLLDQQFALKWTQQHIAKFGGDPTKVTIWGESAGAGSVLQHVVANGGHTTPPLFRAAITSSTFLPSQYAFNDPLAEDLYNAVVNGTGCSSSIDTLSCLRGLNATALQATNVALSTNAFFGVFLFVPVVDGTFITERPTQLLAQRKVNGEALLSITNTFEGAAFVNSNTASTVQIPTYVEQLFPKATSEVAQAVAAQYAGTGAPIDQAIGIMGESIFICPTYFLLRAFPGKSFKGEFAIPPGGHGQDVDYYFTSLNPNGVPSFNNTVFDTAFPDSFLDFAISLNPNIKHNPADQKPLWNTWNQGNTEMLFNKTDSNAPVLRTTTTNDQLLQRCSFWESIGAVTGQ
ncbi:hypothetical protein M422DRAFT_60334 [Sphaerobolus stellatus SS14]|uniref:Carboxylic ester hydrolase n=1 Tax=Sphaerobolus stellatus (strain SS14) TaxID=990650 RepID=A0A0C9V7Y9_SPHS4|nr:hypothetical protein M422DRAFT_60334 [Sphaerobolus stellatus SS14]